MEENVEENIPVAKRARESSAEKDSEADGNFAEGAKVEEKEGEASSSPEEATEGDTAEGQPSQGFIAPMAPTPAQREEHSRSHLPYRGWCDICV